MDYRLPRTALLSMILSLAIGSGYAQSGPNGSKPQDEDGQGNLLFKQQDKIIVFQVSANGIGQGVQVGTATGAINGISIVNFTFKTMSPMSTQFIFDNRVGITDTAGNQILFKNEGMGQFICTSPVAAQILQPFACNSSLLDPTAPPPVPIPTTCQPNCPPAPVGPYQVFGNGVGASLTGTYQVLNVSKNFPYKRFHVGQSFQYKAVTYNPSVPPANPNDLVTILPPTVPVPVIDFRNSLLGTAYVEIRSQD